MDNHKQLFEVPSIAMGLLEQKLAKLAKKAKKAGTSDIKLVRVGRRTEKDGTQICIVAIEGEPVKYEGYTFLARLDHNVDPSGESNIVYSMPGEELTVAQRSLGANCEHCGWKRRRKDTFIMRKDDDGSFIQVGRTCLKDFFGHDPAELVRRAQYITRVIDECRNAEHPSEAYLVNRRTVDMLTFLAYVVSAIEVNGWTSGKDAFGDADKKSTRDQAADTMFLWPYPDPAERPTKEQVVYAEKVIAWVKTLDPTKSDFNFNMTQLAKIEIIDYKSTGIVAAMVFCYNRHLENEVTKSTAPDLTSSEYQGNLLSRLDLDVTVLSSRWHEGQFGSYSITRMLDADGNLFVSFGQYHADPGTEVSIRGTVKRHQDYNGVKQTILSRVTRFSAVLRAAK